MIRGEKTSAEIEAANCYHAYRDGWRAGAATKAMEPMFEQHANPGIRVAYATGYNDGQMARDSALAHASEVYGHTPSILRLA